jgi:4-amino-4-deoxy-L-arabinose transferase-like glycosyltransferase
MSAAQLARWQRTIVLAHVVLALIYGALIPPFEAHDETGHFDYVYQVRTSGALPDPRNADKAFLDQAHQPPAYYLLTASALFWADFSDYARPPRNPFAIDGSNRRGVRILLPRDSDAFPWRGSALALHAARMVSALLGGLTILAIAACARLVFADRPGAALLATAIAAFNPQMIFMAAMVNNDVLVALCGACIALCVLRIGVADDARTRTLLALGASLGLAVASKNSALALIGYVALALLVIGWRARWPLRAWLARALTVAATAALLIAPHIARNVAISGRLLLDRAQDNADKLTPTFFGAGLSQALQDAWLPRIFVNAFRTFWGAFGWGNVQQPESAYALFAVLFFAGLLGCAYAWRSAEARARRALPLLIALALAMAVLPTYRAIAFQDPALLPGRYLMPSLAAYALLIGFGIDALFQMRLAGAVAALLAVWAAVIPLAVLQPAYAARALPTSGATAVLSFADAGGAAIAEIVSVDAESITLPDREGPRLYARVRLRWRALRATQEPLVMGISVVGFDAEALGSVNVHPQRGNYPSTLWRAGDEFVDVYDVLIEKPCARLPALGRVDVALFTLLDDAQRVGSKLTTQDANSAPASSVIGRFKIDAPPLPYPIHWQEPRARFDGALGLRSVSMPTTATAGAPLIVRADFELLAPLARDATVFVHALGPDGALIAQSDKAPAGGGYPLELWDAGECARETFVLNLPADARGPLRIVTGWYDKDGRLTATSALEPDPQKRRFRDDLVEIGTIQVR